VAFVSLLGGHGCFSPHRNRCSKGSWR
jgi:hypothetical protein